MSRQGHIETQLIRLTLGVPTTSRMRESSVRQCISHRDCDHATALTMVVIYERKICVSHRRNKSGLEQDLPRPGNNGLPLTICRLKISSPMMCSSAEYALISARIHPTLHMSIAFVYSLKALLISASTSSPHRVAERTKHDLWCTVPPRCDVFRHVCVSGASCIRRRMSGRPREAKVADLFGAGQLHL